VSYQKSTHNIDRSKDHGKKSQDLCDIIIRKPGRIKSADQGDPGNGIRTRHKWGMENGGDFCDDFKSDENRQNEDRHCSYKYFHRLVVVMEKLTFLETKFIEICKEIGLQIGCSFAITKKIALTSLPRFLGAHPFLRNWSGYPLQSLPEAKDFRSYPLCGKIIWIPKSLPI